MKTVPNRITTKMIEGMAVGQKLTDPTLTGFGVRRQSAKAPTFFFDYRNQDGIQKKVTIGRYGEPWTLEQARREAVRLQADVKIHKKDPSTEKRARRDILTISEVCDEYIKAAEAGQILNRTGKPKKASTLSTDKSRIDSHIRPLIGKLKITAPTSADIESLMRKIAKGSTAKRTKLDKPRALSNRRGGKGAASRTVGLLGGIFTYAVKEGLRADNPVRGVQRYADGKCERRLSDEEYAALGSALLALESDPATMWPAARAAVKFLCVTGWRSGEALNLQYGAVDLKKRAANLVDTKTGQSLRVLSKFAVDILAEQGDGRAEKLFFPPSRGETKMSGFPSYFGRVKALAKLDNTVTPKVLRHSFASVAADLDFSESTIGALVGHKGHTITSRYIHRGDSVLLAAADTIADEIARRMGFGINSTVVDFTRKFA